MKKRFAALIALTMLFTSFSATPLMAADVSASLNNVGVSINGEAATTIAAYNIDGYNYFRLRDIAKKLNYYVSAEGNNITITSSEAYEGGAEASPSTSAKAAVTLVSSHTIRYDDGNAIGAESFNLGGYNYFKLADIQAASAQTAAPLTLGYDGETNTIHITAATASTPAQPPSQSAVASTPQDADYKNFYDQLPKGYSVDGEDFWRIHGYRFDIDKDGIDELLVQTVLDTEFGNDFTVMDVYQYNQNGFEEIGLIGGWVSEFKPSNELVWCQLGGPFKIVTIRDHKIAVETTLAEVDGDMLKYNGKTYDYDQLISLTPTFTSYKS